MSATRWIEQEHPGFAVDPLAIAEIDPALGGYDAARVARRIAPCSRNCAAAGELLRVQSYTVTADYFKTLGVRLVQGRDFTAAEEATVGGTTPVIVDVTLAERLFANENPVGRSCSTARIPAPSTRSPWSSSASRPR